MIWLLILHELLHFWLAFLGALLAWLWTWIIWESIYAKGNRRRAGFAPEVARSISRLFWALLFFLAIGSHVLIDYW